MSVQVVGRATNLLKEVTCRNCLAVLKYAPVAVQSRKVVDYTGCADVLKYLTCPDCSNKVPIK